MLWNKKKQKIIPGGIACIVFVGLLYIAWAYLSFMTSPFWI